MDGWHLDPKPNQASTRQRYEPGTYVKFVTASSIGLCENAITSSVGRSMSGPGRGRTQWENFLGGQLGAYIAMDLILAYPKGGQASDGRRLDASRPKGSSMQ
jgi:hypothetical protein